MHSKVLICNASSYEEEEALEELKTAIDNDESISKELQNKHAVHAYHYINLLLYSITNGKMRSAESIFDYINNEDLTSNFLRACSTYFKNDEYRGDAYRIIAFVKEKNILKDLLKVHLNYKVVEELSRKDEKTNKYLYSNETIFPILHQKQKINKAKSVICTVMLISLMAFLACIVTVGFLPLSSSYPTSTYSEIFNHPIMKFPLYATLGFLCVGIIASGIIYYTESMFQSVEQVQKKLGKDTNSDEELEIEKMNPSTLLEIREPKVSSSVSGAGFASMSDSERDCLIVSCVLL